MPKIGEYITIEYCDKYIYTSAHRRVLEAVGEGVNIISGSRGSGKTRLLQKAVEDYARKGFHVAAGKDSSDIARDCRGILLIYDDIDTNMNIYDLKLQKERLSDKYGPDMPIVILAVGTRRRHDISGVRQLELDLEGFEEILAAMIKQKRDTEFWKNDIKQVIKELYRKSNITGMSRWNDALYPMHPYTLYILMNQDDIAPVEFLTGAFKEFINVSDIFDSSDRPQLYTPDLLYEEMAAYGPDKIRSRRLFRKIRLLMASDGDDEKVMRIQAESKDPVEIEKELIHICEHERIAHTDSLLREERYIYPEAYNETYNEDKRLLRRICSVHEITEHGISSNVSDAYEGVMLHVICENADDITQIQRMVLKNDSLDLIAAIKKSGEGISEALMLLKEAFAHEEAGASLDGEIEAYDRLLERCLKRYLDAPVEVFIGAGVCELQIKDEKDASTYLLKELFEDKRIKVPHKEINLIHYVEKSEDSPLARTVSSLLDHEQPLSYRIDALSDSSDKIYLGGLLAEHGLIKTLRTEDMIVYCEMQNDASVFGYTFPPLFSMIEEIPQLTLPVSLYGFAVDYMRTYGIGQNAFILFFAFAMRYFGDALDIQASCWKELKDKIFHEKNIKMRFRPVNEADKKLIEGLFGILDKKSEDRSVIMTGLLAKKLKDWFDDLPAVCIAKGIYGEGATAGFVELAKNMDQINPRDLILDELKAVYGYDREKPLKDEQVSGLLSEINKSMEMISGSYIKIGSQLMKNIKELFGPGWLAGLSEIQRDPGHQGQSRKSRKMLEAMAEEKDEDKLFLEKLPVEFGFKPLGSWSVDHSEAYLAELKKAKEHIEERVYTIPLPLFKAYARDLTEQSTGDHGYRLKYRGRIRIGFTPGQDGGKVYVTTDGSDPQSSRQEKSYIETDDDIEIRACTADERGRCGRYLFLKLINENNRYRARDGLEFEQGSIFDGPEDRDVVISVVLPKDKEGIGICFENILEKSLDKYKTNREEILEALLELVEKYE